LCKSSTSLFDFFHTLSLKAKFEKQSHEHALRVDDLVGKLTREQDRLRKEGAHEDVGDISVAIQKLRVTPNKKKLNIFGM